MSFFVWAVVAGGIVIFYVIGFQPEIRRWKKKRKERAISGGEISNLRAKTKMSIFGVPIIRRKE